MITFDNVPVVILPDGRWALMDTGCNGADILANKPTKPIAISGDLVHPTLVPTLDVEGIARGIGAPKLDVLVGVNVLYRGFTLDLRHREAEFKARPPLVDEETVAVLPYTRPATGMLTSPLVTVELGGQPVEGIFDTGASYSLWKRRKDEPGRPAHTMRRDFHVGHDGKTCEFDVLARRESMRIGDSTIELDIAYMPESLLTAAQPRLIVGMDVPAALGATAVVLGPDRREILFYGLRSSQGIDC